VDLGGGSFAVVASVYAEGTDGQVGTLASSGHEIQPDDNLVALPACTESSCPWVPVGTGIGSRFGPQTDCAEADGLCWVQIVSDETGACTVAPVHDRGPLFVRDNWWAPLAQREYNVPQGVPAAEYAADGTDFGFGSGISDAGYDIRNVYDYAAGIDLAAGTWKALGLPVTAGISPVTVTMLWQAGITHDAACSGAPAPAPNPGDPSGVPTQPAINPTQPVAEPTQPAGVPTQSPSQPTEPGAIAGNATVIDGELILRSTAGTDGSVLDVMPAGATVSLTGQSVAGFLSVSYQSVAGWASAEFLDLGGPAAEAGALVKVIDGALNLRSTGSTDGEVLQVLDDGAELTLTGETGGGYLGVTFDGTSGWAFASYLELVSNEPANTATVLDGALNLRAEANQSAEVLMVIPDGATVSLLGRTENGFSEISYNGAAGWAASMYLSNGETGAVDPAGHVTPGSEDGETVAPGESQSGNVTPSAGDSGDAVSATVTGGNLNLRSGASTSDTVLTVIPDGATVTLLGETSNGFARIQFDGVEGWAWAACLN
jgi:uncharacterized protein YgiM (DUF1202 family)